MMTWKVSAPISAPIGSMVVLSQARILLTRRSGRASCSSGATTVGPDTIRMAPSITDACSGNPSSSPPNAAAPAQVIGTPR
jgi:hypothetical protein